MMTKRRLGASLPTFFLFFVIQEESLFTFTKRQKKFLLNDKKYV